MPARQPNQRKADREAAFAYWYADGEYRTHREVAAEFGVTQRAVEIWARDEDWNARAAQLDGAAREAVMRKLARQAAKRLQADIGASDFILGEVLRGVRDGSIKLSASEALAWRKHAYLLSGGVTERREEVERGEESRAVVDAVAQELAGLSVDQLEAEELIDP